MKAKGKTQESKLLEKELLTDEDLMVLLGISKESVRRWREKGYLQFFSIGPRCYYPSKFLKKMIKESFHPYYKKKNRKSALDTENEKTNDKA
jgi:hypothetical protein